MMQSLIGSRKRCRNLGEEDTRDFTPLSKRINNLHINTNGSYHESNKSSLEQNDINQVFSNSIHWNGIPNNTVDGNHSNNTNPQSSHGLVQVNGHSVEPSGVSIRQVHHPCSNAIPIYNPDLSIGENPFYYESNKLLFQLYQERLQRSTHSQY